MADYANIPLDSRRVPLATKVQFKFDRFSGFISEYSANISPSGMFIVSEKPEPVGRILDLEFRLGDGFEIITGQGEVVWSRSVPDGPSRPPGMGIRFMELSPGSKDLIRRIVDQYVAQGGTPFDLTGMYTAPPAPQPEPDLPPLAQEPDPFELPDPVRESSGSAFPWHAEPKDSTKEGGLMSSGKELPPLEPLDEEIFKLEDPAPPAPVVPAPAQPVLPFLSVPAAPEAPAEDPFPPFIDPLEMTQAGPTVGFEAEEPFPPPAAFEEPARPPASVSSPGPADTAPLAPPTLGPDDETFAVFLPKQAPPTDAPAVRPLATLAGGASVHQPRRVSPLLLGLLLLVALGAAGFFLRDQIAGWIGLGGGEEVADAQTPPVRRAEPTQAGPPPTLQEELSLTSDAMASTLEPPAQPGDPAREPAAEPVAELDPEPARPLPEVVQRKPATPAPAAAAPAPASGPAVTAIERITFEPAPGGTVVVLWGNGAIRPESYRRISLTDPAREVIQIRGMRQPFSPARIQAGTGELRQIRVGYHQKGGDNELHIVLDLGGPRVKVQRVEPDGQRLRIHLQGS